MSATAAAAAVKNIVKALEPYTSCDVADALSKLKVPHGGFLPGLTMWSPQRQSGPTKICGPAYTVRYVRHDKDKNDNTSKQAPSPPPPPPPAAEKEAPAIKGHYIDSVPSGSILFISAPQNMINACYGGLMSTRAQYLGASGTIVDGRIRDLTEHRDLDFPVFALDVGTTAPAEEARVESINEAVKVNSEHYGGRKEGKEVWVHPGDWLVADLNGVVCVPQGMVEEVVGLVGSQVEADEKVAEDIRQGKLVGESMKRWRAGVKQPKLA